MSEPGSGGYRRDIDGLRALAVLPVVLFHAGVPGLSGGYVGVDVFFVISGFLITGILRGDLTKERFSLVRFYDRRIRRIFPALMVVLAATTVAGLILMTPMFLRDFGKELAATALFVSNLLFAAENGYFAGPSHEHPLLHTWSLAVEEQFYILWPPLLWLAHRWFPRWLPALAGAIGIGSFVVAVWWTEHDPGDAFYLPWTRFWELMIGAVLALRPVEIRSRPLREGLAIAGLLLIIGAIVAFDEKTIFPGPMALIPCLGAALCLVANRAGDTFGARLLSLRPIVFVGLVSYSFYLWHWPLIALARYRLMEAPSVPLALGLAAASFVLAVLSWRFIEQPFRHPTHSAREQGQTIAAGVASILVVAAVAVVLQVTQGLPARAPVNAIAAEKAASDHSKYARRCDGSPEVGPCRAGPPGPEEVVLWGDSHARAFAPTIEGALAEGQRMRLYTQSGCLPLLDVDRKAFGQDPRNCRPSNADILAAIADNPGVRVIILAGRWSFYTEAQRVGSEEGSIAYLIDDKDDRLSQANSRRVFREGLDRTLAALRETVRPDVRIILMESAPEVGFSVPNCFARRRMWRESTEVCERLDRAAIDARQRFARETLRAAAERWPNVTTYRFTDRFCSGKLCLTRQGDTLLYSDDNHLSIAGGKLLAKDFPLELGKASGGEK